MTRWHRWWRRARLDRELDAELRDHVERLAADYAAAGLEAKEAKRRALIDFGGLEQFKEASRDVRGTQWLVDAGADAAFALRSLRRNKGFAAVALSTLALGIGATTLMFTVADGVILRPLPFPDPGRLLRLQEQTEQATAYGNLWAFAYPNFTDLQQESRTLSAGAWRPRFGTVSGPGPAEYVAGYDVSANFFDVLGVAPALGRAFRNGDESRSAPPVAMISHALWNRQFGARASVLGETLVFDGMPYTVVGVVPQTFRWVGEADVILPIGRDQDLVDRGRHALGVVARLQPDATLDGAQAELTTIGRRLAAAYPGSNDGRTFVAERLRPEVGSAATTIWLLMGAVSLVLLIACVNVASLQLARAVSRERELAMRTALGAGRGRLVRQCLVESTLLALMGGALGVALAIAGLGPFVAWWPGGLPRADGVALDAAALTFALGVSIVSGVAFGVAPALRVPLSGIEKILRAGRQGGITGRPLSGTFVIAEVALAVVLLVSAGLLARTLLDLSALDPGVRVANLLVTRMALSPSTLNDPDKARATWSDVLDRARRVPGVASVALVDTVPMREGNNQLPFWPAPVFPSQDQVPLALATSVTPEYLDVVGLSLLAGRFVDERDGQGSEAVVVIDDVLARRAFGSDDPLGRQIWIPGSSMSPLRVVGVVRHVRHWGLAGDDDAGVRAQLYYAFAQIPDSFVRRWSELMSLAVRTTVPPLGVVDPLRRVLRGALGDQVLYEVRTMDQLAAASLSQQRFLLLIVGAFAMVALLLSSIGVYGVLNYATRQRVREMGLRLALGATGRSVIRLVLAQSLRVVLLGVGVGIAAALGAGQLLLRVVPGMVRPEPWTFALMALVLMFAALLAGFLPAWRASRVDPIETLRCE